ncbi:hypothetical protein WJX84_001989, partial [Apatococcus fuscideae]
SVVPAPDSNALILSNTSQDVGPPQEALLAQPCVRLTKAQLRKLRQVEAAAEKRVLRHELYGELAKHGLTADQAALLKGSASRGAKATLQQSRAELGLPEDGRGSGNTERKSSSGNRKLGPTRVVHIQRPAAIEEARSQLPIIGQEQEIVEAITDHLVIVLCGETGCGKTTQVPQFLLEAGYGCRRFPERAGMVAVTQPRRLAAISSAQRVAAELGHKVGPTVGYQVRHDRQVGKDCALKFMTDGILLREMQQDFLLRKYSIVIIDEAHERSLNSDILLGMLSRIVPLRQSMAKSPASGVQPLRLVIMSATLRTEDFTANQRLFSQPPPVLHVPARQFPVTVHFNRRTEQQDYIGAAFSKVCKIHRQLPPGGVLVFLSGEREVQELVARLRQTFPDKPRAAAGVASSSLPGAKDAKAPKRSRHAADGPQGDAHKEVAEEEEGLAGLTGGLDAAESSDPTSRSRQEGSQGQDEGLWDSEGDNALVETDEEDDVVVLGDLSWAVASDSTLQADEPAGDEERPTGPVQALPLYALLPAAAQAKVFQPAPPGHRQIIAATNVAETSLTIPGIRYVVDAGRAKQRLLEEGHTGMARFEVRWISKASAEQRAGRAGRTGPGHCYRLYSSAHYNDTFPKHTPPEILNTPLEGVVLLLKAMAVDKVAHFPLPTPVEEGALAAAERCLVALAALTPDTRALTPLGMAMAALPISPRHARMIHQVVADAEAGRKGAQKALPYAIALAAALDAESPFIRPDSLVGDEGEDGQAVRARRRKAYAAHALFTSPAGDALSALRVLCAYEAAGCSEHFCRDNFLHARNLREMGAARRQLAGIMSLSLASAAGRKAIAGRRRAHPAGQDALQQAVEGSVAKDPGKHVLECLRRAIAAGWADQIARRVHATFIKPRAGAEGEEGRSSRAIRYKACCLEEDVYLHPSSGLAKTGPQWIAYTQLLRSGKRPYMGGGTAIEAHWLPEVAAPLCTFSAPLLDPPPAWDKEKDSVHARHEVTYGGHAWPLPHHSRPHPDAEQRYATFAAALLEGRVFPALAGMKQHWALVVTNQILVGHLGATPLAAAALGITIFNAFFEGLFGIATAFDTLGSQAFGAADRAALLSWMVCAFAVLSALCFPIAGILLCGEPIAATIFHQPPDIAQMVGEFCRWYIPGLWPFAWSIVLMKALQVQNLFWAPAWACAATCLFNIGMTYAMVQTFGFQGAAAANSAARLLLFLIIGGYAITWGRRHLDLHGTFNKESAERDAYQLGSGGPEQEEPLLAAAESEGQGTGGDGDMTWSIIVKGAVSLPALKTFLRLGLPGGLNMAADGIAFDITTAFAGFLGTIDLDAHTSLLTLVTFLYFSFPSGVGQASTIRVGNLLGAGQPARAQISGGLCCAMGLGFQTVAAVALLLLRNQVGYIFVDDDRVVERVAALVPLATFYMVPDGFLGSVQGVLRGLGWQLSIMIFNIVGFWSVGIVTEYYLTFPRGQGLEGLWRGIAAGVFVTCALNLVAVLRIDWSAEARTAQDRLEAMDSARKGRLQQPLLERLSCTVDGSAP